MKVAKAILGGDVGHRFLVDAMGFADDAGLETSKDSRHLASLLLSCRGGVSSKERSKKGWKEEVVRGGPCSTAPWLCCQEHGVGSAIQTPPVLPV